MHCSVLFKKAIRTNMTKHPFFFLFFFYFLFGVKLIRIKWGKGLKQKAHEDDPNMVNEKLLCLLYFMTELWD